MNRFIIPLGIFVTLVVLLAVGLTLNPREIPSPFIGKPAPDFTLAELDESAAPIQRDDLLGDVWILNVFASWCLACQHEHPLLMDLSEQTSITLVGLNYKDKRNDAINWLTQFGDPYDHIGHDLDGNVGIDYGVYGVPETFVIDKDGIVRLKHIGPFNADDLRDTILPLIRSLKENQG